MSWLDWCVYAVFARQNGIRLLLMIATRRGA